MAEQPEFVTGGPVPEPREFTIEAYGVVTPPPDLEDTDSPDEGDEEE